MKEVLKRFLKEEDGMGTVEIVLIIVVLIALVMIFKSKIKAVVNKAMNTITTNSNSVMSD